MDFGFDLLFKKSIYSIYIRLNQQYIVLIVEKSIKNQSFKIQTRCQIFNNI